MHGQCMDPSLSPLPFHSAEQRVHIYLPFPRPLIPPRFCLSNSSPLMELPILVDCILQLHGILGFIPPLKHAPHHSNSHTFRYIGVTYEGQSVTLEPGGQFELSGAPVETIHKTCAVRIAVMYPIVTDLNWILRAASLMLCRRSTATCTRCVRGLERGGSIPLRALSAWRCPVSCTSVLCDVI
jgi:hypothetical protein